MVRDNQGKLVAVEWEDALVATARALQSANGDQLAALVGGFADAEARTSLLNCDFQHEQLIANLVSPVTGSCSAERLVEPARF